MSILTHPLPYYKVSSICFFLLLKSVKIFTFPFFFSFLFLIFANIIYNEITSKIWLMSLQTIAYIQTKTLKNRQKKQTVTLQQGNLSRSARHSQRENETNTALSLTMNCASHSCSTLQWTNRLLALAFLS